MYEASWVSLMFVVVLQAPLAIVLGEQDDDPFHKHLNRSDRAMVQGNHRLARGRHFFEVDYPPHLLQEISATNGNMRILVLTDLIRKIACTSV
jgi:hypothetical protein